MLSSAKLLLRGDRDGKQTGTGQDPETTPTREQIAKPLPTVPTAAEELFFEAINRDPALATRAQRALRADYLADPQGARSALLLGLSHLWAATEQNRADASGFDHLLLSEYFLERAAVLDSNDNRTDDRLVSWLVPVRASRAALEGHGPALAAHLAPLLEANQVDPCFHSFALALLCRKLPKEDPLFVKALGFLRAATECSADDPSVQNLPRWPHNREGFLLIHAEFEWRAGDAMRAEQALAAIETTPSYPEWPYRQELVELRDRVRLDPTAARAERLEPGQVTEPASWMAGHSCQVCHRGP